MRNRSYLSGVQLQLDLIGIAHQVEMRTAVENSAITKRHTQDNGGTVDWFSERRADMPTRGQRATGWHDRLSDDLRRCAVDRQRGRVRDENLIPAGHTKANSILTVVHTGEVNVSLQKTASITTSVTVSTQHPKPNEPSQKPSSLSQGMWPTKDRIPGGVW